MRKLLIFLPLLITCNLFSQVKTKIITINNKETRYCEKISVMKTNNNIKHGTYKKLIKDRIIETGQYDNDVKIGNWKYFDWAGKEYLNYDYSKNEITFFKSDSEKQIVIIDSDTVRCLVERPVLFNGSIYEIQNFVNRNLRYPEYAAVNGIMGKVYVGLVINSNGEFENTYLIRGVEKSLNNESIRVMKEFKGNFFPAIYQGQKVKSVLIFPVTFVLQ